MLSPFVAHSCVSSVGPIIISILQIEKLRLRVSIPDCTAEKSAQNPFIQPVLKSHTSLAPCGQFQSQLCKVSPLERLIVGTSQRQRWQPCDLRDTSRARELKSGSR